MTSRIQLTLCMILLFIFTLALCVPLSVATTGWSKTYAGKTSIIAAMTQTSDGGYAVAGYLELTNSSGTVVSRDPWLAKTDSSGNIQWNKTFSGRMPYVNSVVQTSDDGYAIAGSEWADGTSPFLLKTDSFGNMQWNKTYGPSGGAAYSLINTNDGGYALAGSEFAHNSFMLVKVDSNGNLQWRKDYGGTQDLATGNQVANMAYSLIQTNDGGYALVGQGKPSDGGGHSAFWFGKVDSSGNMQWNKTLAEGSAYSVVQTNDKGYAIAGTGLGTGANAGSADAWLVKTDLSGNIEWNKTYGGTSHDEAFSMVKINDGGFAIAGYTDSFGAGMSDAWLIKTDSFGNMQWNKTYGGYREDDAGRVFQTSDGGFILAGYTNSSGIGGNSFWLLKTDENGVVPEFPYLLMMAGFMAFATSTILICKRKMANSNK